MAKVKTRRRRPDITAAERGGDWSKGMEHEGVPGDATMEQALYWKQIYTEILTMEEKVLATNVPVVVAQAERFRQRLSYWEARIHELGGAVPPQRGRAALATT